MLQGALPSLEGQSVLVVEDQVLIALDIEDMLLGLGAAECRLASSVADAITLLEAKVPALALLDFNLGEETAEPIADRLMALGLPFVFVTGYGDDLAMPERYRAIPIVGKPVTRASLAGKIRQAQG